jgi:diguanylate cyclase (GGDEF)-like protein
LLLVFLLCSGGELWAWKLSPTSALPSQVAAQLPPTSDYLPGRQQRVYYELLAIERGRNGAHSEYLVFERDRGNRAWVIGSAGNVLHSIPIGSAPAPARIGVRGLALALTPPRDAEEVRYVIVDSVLGVHPRVRIESAERFYERERAIWIYEVSLGSSLLMLMLLTLAFSAILREPGTLAYLAFLGMMLLSIALRHPIAFRLAESVGVGPERIAALGVLMSTAAVLATVSLIRAASGIGSRFPRGSRWMQWIALATIALGLIDVLAIQSNFALAQQCFALINFLFGVIAVVSATFLCATAWSGGRSARLFLLGWAPMVVVGAWFSVGSLVGVPQTENPHRWVMFACVLQAIVWACALGDRAVAMRRERDRAWALAELDELTGLPNRRMLDRELSQARSGWVLIFDLDGFKAVNDRYGHAVGDSCLVHFAQCMREALAGDAVFGRYGGEEFIAIVPVGDRSQACMLAERLRERTSSTPVHAAGDLHCLTVSVGIASLDASDARDALAEADRALYRAKSGGRNRVELAT